jgi:hypothetical protein
MIAGFLAIIYMGHVPLVLLVLTLQVSEGCACCVMCVPSTACQNIRASSG